MKTIEQTAVECGAYIIKHEIANTICFNEAQLQAFFAARCAELSEPVGEVRCRNGEVYGYIGKKENRENIALGSKLYLHPPKQPLAVPSGWIRAEDEHVPFNQLIQVTLQDEIKTHGNSEIYYSLATCEPSGLWEFSNEYPKFFKVTHWKPFIQLPPESE